MSQREKKPVMGRPKGKPRTDAEIAADEKRTGRPTITEGENASIGVSMRLTPTEYKQFAKEAKRLKMGLAAYMRYCWNVAREGK